MFCSLMSVFLYFSGFESFAPLERWCDFAKFWCGKKKLVAVYCEILKCDPLKYIMDDPVLIVSICIGQFINIYLKPKVTLHFELPNISLLFFI